MAGGPSLYLAHGVMNKVLKQTDFTAPAGLWVALFTTASETYLRSNTIASANECPNTGGYARQSVPFVNISAPSNGQSQITVDLTFPTATGAWGTIYQAALVDSATIGAGNIWWFGPLSASASIQVGDVLKIPAYSFNINM